ncbi:Histidine ammonia-lyase [Streptomyces glaucescens]
MQAADIFTTDPTITKEKFVVLQDPKNLFGFANVTPLVHKSGLTQEGVDTLNAVSAKLDTKTLLDLDSQVQLENKDPLDVAKSWLKSVGLDLTAPPMSTATDGPPLCPEGAWPSPAEPGRQGVTLDGAGLTAEDVVRLADGAALPVLPAKALARVRRSWRAAQRLAAAGRLYGRGTGVGAHHSVVVGADDEAGHGLRLLRSHAGGAGAPLPARQVRAMLAVRANQLLAGGSGIHPDLVEGLAQALRLGRHPMVLEYGGLGTGDLTALAETGLALIGERPWLPPGPGPTPAPVPLRPGDALALLSSNALVLGQAALAWHALDTLLRAGHAVARVPRRGVRIAGGVRGAAARHPPVSRCRPRRRRGATTAGAAGTAVRR